MEISLACVYLTFDCSLHVYVLYCISSTVSSGQSDTRREHVREDTGQTARQPDSQTDWWIIRREGQVVHLSSIWLVHTVQYRRYHLTMQTTEHKTGREDGRRAEA